MRFNRHAYLGRDDDRDDPTLHLRSRDPRAGWVPQNGGGLDHDPAFYAQPAVPLPNPPHRDAVERAPPPSSWSTMRARGHDPDANDAPGVRTSDARVYERVRNAIEADGDVDVRFVFVRVIDGEVELRGLVADLEERGRVEELAWSASGVVDVANRLRVR